MELEYFADSLRKHGQEIPGSFLSWREAFNELERLITNGGKEDRKVIFIDEMPWLDTPDSDFITAFAHFWNDFVPPGTI